jgi:ribosomal protein S8
VFPTILYYDSAAYTLDIINMNTARKTLFFYIKYTYKINILIKIFKKLTLIENYSLVKKNNILFFKIAPFYYKNFPSSKNFKLISSVTRSIFISLRGLFLLNKRSGNSLYLISTSNGILTHKEALKKKTSGFVLGFFYN